jgi:hypothetical protein
MVYISRLRQRMLQEGVVTKRRRGAQVSDENRKSGTGVKPLESKGLECGLERDAAVQGLTLELVLIDRVLPL